MDLGPAAREVLREPQVHCLQNPDPQANRLRSGKEEMGNTYTWYVTRLSPASGRITAKAPTGRHAALPDFYRKSSRQPSTLIVPMSRRHSQYWRASCDGKINCWAARLLLSRITGHWNSLIPNGQCRYDRFVGMSIYPDLITHSIRRGHQERRRRRIITYVCGAKRLDTHRRLGKCRHSPRPRGRDATDRQAP
jgi:hypothetical protein